MNHLAVRRAHLHGYSFGGGVITQLLAHSLERFISAVFGGSGVREMNLEWKARVPQEKAGVDPQDVEARQKASALPGRDQEAIDALLKSKESFVKASLDLTKTATPVLAINGEFDQPNAKTSRMQRELRNFKSVVLPGKSHLTAIFPGYMPELYLESVSKPLLKEVPADECAAQVEERLMDVVAPLVSDFQPAIAIQPRTCSFHDPAVAAQSLARLDALARDPGRDAAPTERRTQVG